MKKLALVFSIGFVFLISATSVLAAQQIDSFYTDIQIEKDSSIIVEERIYYNFGEEQKHGIYREVPYKYRGTKKNIKLKISDISVTDEDANPLNFVTSEGNGIETIKIGDADKYVTGVKVYKIRYRVEKAINYFSDNDELYWNATGDQWAVPIEQSKMTIIFPEDVSDAYLKATCYAGSQGSDSSCVSYRYNYKGKGMVDKVIFTDDKLNPGEGLTVVVAMPKGLVNEPSLIEKIIITVSDNLILLFPILVLFGMYKLWDKKGKDPKGRGTIIAQFDAPDNLSPAEIGALINGQVDNHEISAEIIYLATLGYLKIFKVEKDNLLFDTTEYIIQKVKNGDDLKNDFDKLFMEKLFKDKYLKDSWQSLKKLIKKGKIDTSSPVYNSIIKAVGLQSEFDKDDVDRIQNKNLIQLSSLKKSFYEDLQIIKKDILQSVIDEGYYPNNPNNVKISYIALAFFVGIIGFYLSAAFFGQVGFLSSVASALIIGIFGWFMPTKTKKGALATEHILGLKDYLNVAEKDRINFHNAPEKNPEIFEKLLPFAMALKVEKNWAKQFKDIYDQNPSWYGSTQYGHFSSIALANGLGDFSTSAKSSMTSTASSGGSGFSGGGAGGGFGGGGGGSW